MPQKPIRRRRQATVPLVRRIAPLVVILLLAVSTAFDSRVRASAQDPAAQVVSDIAPEALAQIEALVRDKESRSPIERKIDSQLIYASRRQAGLPITAGVADLETDVPYAPDGHAVVDVKGRVTPDLLARLTAMGAEVLDTSPDRSSARVHLDLDQVASLAASPDVDFIQPRQDAITSRMTSSQASRVLNRDEWIRTRSIRRQQQRESLAAFLRSAGDQPQLPNLVSPASGVGSRASEGDLAHRAFDARGTFHVDGTGVKIGVLSNGVVNLATSQALGDLGPVTVLPGQTGTGDEGTAMLEIVHDLAPGAQLYFATAFTSLTSFAQNIRDLRAAGCDIIVDDVFYFVETPFQDGAPGPTNTNGGAVIQAVKDVTAAGALYFSSAGNSGNLNDGTSGVWEGDFADGGAVAVPVPGTGRLHSFGASTFDTLLAASRVNLYWSDPLGGSSNDYDLFVLNAAGTSVVGSSTNVQTGSQDPYEDVGNRAAGLRVVIRKSTAAAGRFLHLNTNRGVLAIATAGQTHGHSTVDSAGAYGVAATPAAAFAGPPNPAGPFPNPFNASNRVELFSSDGPRRIFYQGNGTAFTTGNVSSTGGKLLIKPDITAADGVSVTGVGGFGSPFFGTSAAAPHAGAIAALLKQGAPALTQAQVRAALAASAIDIEAAGVDRDSGAGIIMAQGALAVAGAVGTAFVTIDTVVATENPGDGNGVINHGEGAKLVISLKNLGVADATALSAVLTSSTPGITVTLPGASAYPNLPVSSAAASDTSPFLFTVGSTVPCPLVVDFKLTVTYTGGPSPSAILPFTVSTGTNDITITSVLDTTAPVVPSLVTSAITGDQTLRLNRNGVTSVCGALKPFPGTFGAGTRRFDAYTIDSCSATPACVSASLASTPTGANPALFATAYSPSFDPTNLATNYLADPGGSGTTGGFVSFGFTLPPSQRFVVNVNEVNQGLGLGASYTLKLSGGCFGPCTVPNQVPIAKATNVTVSADASCHANASIDDGSFDPDGDALTITQSPAGPYPLGTTPVLLTVTDPKGATSQATGSVTVVDTTPPPVTGFALSTASLWPPNHQMVDVTVDYGASDSCSGVTCALTVASSEPVNGTGDGDTSPDWEIVDAHHVRLRAERAGSGPGRIYTITLTCTDGAGNVTVRTATVAVPHSSQ